MDHIPYKFTEIAGIAGTNVWRIQPWDPCGNLKKETGISL
jgi:hypothetical protein